MAYRAAAETLVGCIRIPQFGVQVERWRRPELAGQPLALVTAARQPVVAACSPEAEAEGVRLGMPLRQVLGVSTRILLLTADAHRYEQVFAAVLAGLELVSPVVEPGPAGLAYAGLEGLLPEPGARGARRTAALYRQPEELVQALEAAVCLPLETRIGIGRGKFVAWAAASLEAEGHVEADGPEVRSCWVPDDRREELLRPLPVELLPVSEGMRRRLAAFGIQTLGKLAALPLSAVLAQFGPEGRRAWHLARGRDDDPLHPRDAVLEIAETLRFPSPEAMLDALLAAVRELLERALRRPERRGGGVRQIRLDARLESGLVWTQTTTIRRPSGEPALLFPPLRYHLEREHPPEAAEELTLVLTAFTQSLGGQRSLFPEPHQERRERLAEELRQLRTRMGEQPVCRVLELEPWSRLPERRFGLIRYDP
ncbi:MAG: hypothetical protein ACK47B_24740 [Armatimonadota bacterium]